MLLTLYNEAMASGNPTSLPQIVGGSTYVLPGGAGVIVTGTTPNPWVGVPRLESVYREVLDITNNGGVPTPAAIGNVIALNFPAAQVGGADWAIPTSATGTYFRGQIGVVFKNGSTAAIDEYPLGSGVGAVVCTEGPVLALCVAPTAGGAIAAGTLLATDGAGNLQPLQPPAAAPTPTVTPVGTTGAVAYSYALVNIGINGTYSAIGTAGSTSTGNATLTNANYNQITWTPTADSQGYIVVRTASAGSPATVGTIGRVPAGVNVFNDTALAILTGTTATQPFETFGAVTGGAVAQVSGATAGTTTWTYKVAAIGANGIWGTASSNITITTGAATLSPTQGNSITWTPTPGASLFAIQRSAAGGTPSSTGFIGYASVAQATTGFVDYGQAATTYTQNLTPSPISTPGVALARALGPLATTTTPTLVPVFFGPQ